MYSKFVLTVFAFTCLLHFINADAQAAPVRKSTCISQDSVPPINTIAGENIDTVRERRKTNTIDVTLKNGQVYSYDAVKLRKQWENKPGLPHKIEAVVNDWQKTFTRVENPASFPGGDTARNAYIRKYAAENKEALKNKGSGQVSLMFIVDTDGELSAVEVFKSDNNRLSAVAIDALQKGPFWLPAVQNGRKVVAYQKVTIIF